MRKKIFNQAWGFALGLLIGMGGVALAQNILNYSERGGARWVVGGSLDIVSGGDLDIESGGVLTVVGSDITPELLLLDGLTASTADLNATTNFEETISATTSEVSIATAKTLNIVDVAGLEIAGTAVTSDATELNILDGVTASTGDLNATTNFEETLSATTSEVTIPTGKTFDITDVGGLEIATVSVTADAGELNIMDGVTASTNDLNATTNFEETISATTSEVTIPTGKTFDITDVGGLEIATVSVSSDAGELNILDGVTASTADINATTNFEETISATTDEVAIATGKTLNIVDVSGLEIAGTAVTGTAVELNYVDIATLGTAEELKVVTSDSNLDTTGIRNLTMTGDTVISDPTNGGDAGERNTLTANFNITIKSTGSMTNGSTEGIPLFSDTPATECAEVGGQTATNDNTVVRVGTNSLKLEFESTPPVADEGVDCTFAGGADDFGSNESIGFWFRTDTAMTASGDIYAELDDDGGTDVQFDLPAVNTINTWSWIELDISTCATCDVVDAIKFFVDTDGATRLSGATVWFDFAWKWDADDEEALGVDIVQDGVLGLVVAATAAGTGNTVSDLVENTGFFVNYQSGNDVLVTMTDQSANYGIAFVAKR